MSTAPTRMQSTTPIPTHLHFIPLTYSTVLHVSVRLDRFFLPETIHHLPFLYAFVSFLLSDFSHFIDMSFPNPPLHGPHSMLFGLGTEI
mmetsp:Transcript_19390/g.32255  ORF Transcript_19390/g.32255 Transcript_19390/m.32255 type:complete len:89 (-) Transcript_19390:202-468(-)